MIWTPGPWHGEKTGPRIVIRGPNAEYIGTVDHAQGIDVRDANARIMIAAPELYAELDDVIDLAAEHAQNERRRLDHPRNKDYLDGLDARVAKARAALRLAKEGR